MAVNKLLMQELKQIMSVKQAFVPPGAGMPPGGAPPMDPAAMGGMPPGGAPPMPPGMPPGGAPPMDPAMAGGAPPMDPAAMGGAPPMDPAMAGGAPPAGGPSPDDIKMLIQQEVQKAMSGGAAPGAASGADGKPKGAGKAKVDPAQLIEYMERQQRLLVNLYESLELPLPYNILDKPSDGEEGKDQPKPEESAPAPTASDASGIPPIKPIQPIGGDKQASLAEKLEAAKYLAMALGKR